MAYIVWFATSAFSFYCFSNRCRSNNCRRLDRGRIILYYRKLRFTGNNYCCGDDNGRRLRRERRCRLTATRQRHRSPRPHTRKWRWSSRKNRNGRTGSAWRWCASAPCSTGWAWPIITRNPCRPSGTSASVWSPRAQCSYAWPCAFGWTACATTKMTWVLSYIFRNIY